MSAGAYAIRDVIVHVPGFVSGPLEEPVCLIGRKQRRVGLAPR